MRSLLAITAVLSLAASHNWLNSPSRSRQEAKGFPCGEKDNPPSQPQAQVALGQKFDIELITGHPNTDWWLVTARVEDQDMVGRKYDRSSLPRDLKKYIEEGLKKGGDVDQLKNNPQFRRHHIVLDGVNKNKNKMDGELSKKSPEYFEVEDIFWEKSVRKDKADDKDWEDRSHYRYSDSQLKNDLGRVAYQSDDDDLEWMLSASHFKNQGYEESREWDLMKIDIPERAGAGRYVVMYTYAGWHDCMDVQVLQTSTEIPGPMVYGGKPVDVEPVYKYEKTMHSTLTAWDQATDCKRVPTSSGIPPCLEDCIEEGIDKCSHVLVVPYKNPENVFPGEDINHKCNRDFSAGDYVCFGVTMKDGGKLESSKDAESSLFYSATFELQEEVFASSGGVLPQPVLQYRYGPYCFSCEDREKYAAERLDPDKFSFLEVGKDCQHCDL